MRSAEQKRYFFFFYQKGFEYKLTITGLKVKIKPLSHYFNLNISFCFIISKRETQSHSVYSLLSFLFIFHLSYKIA